MAATVASITPASTPFQPACTAATTCCWLTIATGAQSATFTESTSPDRSVTKASASIGSRMGSSITTVVAPCTWVSDDHGNPTTACRRAARPSAGGTARRSPSARVVNRLWATGPPERGTVQAISDR